MISRISEPREWWNRCVHGFRKMPWKHDIPADWARRWQSTSTINCGGWCTRTGCKGIDTSECFIITRLPTVQTFFFFPCSLLSTSTLVHIEAAARAKHGGTARCRRQRNSRLVLAAATWRASTKASTRTHFWNVLVRAYIKKNKIFLFKFKFKFYPG